MEEGHVPHAKTARSAHSRRLDQQFLSWCHQSQLHKTDRLDAGREDDLDRLGRLGGTPVSDRRAAREPEGEQSAVLGASVRDAVRSGAVALYNVSLFTRRLGLLPRGDGRVRAVFFNRHVPHAGAQAAAVPYHPRRVRPPVLDGRRGRVHARIVGAAVQPPVRLECAARARARPDPARAGVSVLPRGVPSYRPRRCGRLTPARRQRPAGGRSG